jgi:GT2 family glycosyltransferase
VRVSVCIVTYEAGRWLRPCIESVLAQSYSATEIIVVDNRSHDGTRATLASMAASTDRLRFATNESNQGFARGQNQAIAMSTGEAICLLNQDVEMDPEFLASAVGALRADPRIGSIQGRVRRLAPTGERTDIVDTCGLLVRPDRRFLSRGQAQLDGPAFDAPGFVFGADGPCPVYRREALEDIREPRTGGGTEILDEDFFLYHEDTDLAWRLQLRGWHCYFEPSALAWHARGVASAPSVSAADIARHRRGLSEAARLHGWKNHRLMQLKNEQGALFLRDLLPILRRELESLALMTFTRPSDLRALVWLARCLPAARRKRASIQRRRTAPRDEIARWFKAG